MALSRICLAYSPDDFRHFCFLSMDCIILLKGFPLDPVNEFKVDDKSKWIASNHLSLSLSPSMEPIFICECNVMFSSSFFSRSYILVMTCIRSVKLAANCSFSRITVCETSSHFWSCHSSSTRIWSFTRTLTLRTWTGKCAETTLGSLSSWRWLKVRRWRFPANGIWNICPVVRPTTVNRKRFCCFMGIRGGNHCHTRSRSSP